MNPYLEARKVYSREECLRSFEEDLLRHLQSGFVYSSPTLFAMWRPVPRDADEGHIVDSWQCWDERRCDCIHVYLAAGDLSELLEIIEPKEWICFERKNVLRFYRFQSIMKRLDLWKNSTDLISLPT